MANAALESMFRAYAREHPNDAARALEALPAKQAAPLVKSLPPRYLGPVLERLNPDAAATLLEALGPEEVQELLSPMESRHVAAILHHLEDAAREAMLTGLGAAHAKRIRVLLKYPSDTASQTWFASGTLLRFPSSTPRASCSES